jgi:hypothetical protein
MKAKTAGTLAIFAGFAFISSGFAQDLGPQVRKLSDGVYVVAGNNFNSNSGIVLLGWRGDRRWAERQARKSDIVEAHLVRCASSSIRNRINHTTGHFVSLARR